MASQRYRIAVFDGAARGAGVKIKFFDRAGFKQGSCYLSRDVWQHMATLLAARPDLFVIDDLRGAIVPDPRR